MKNRILLIKLLSRLERLEQILKIEIENRPSVHFKLVNWPGGNLSERNPKISRPVEKYSKTINPVKIEKIGLPRWKFKRKKKKLPARLPLLFHGDNYKRDYAYDYDFGHGIRSNYQDFLLNLCFVLLDLILITKQYASFRNCFRFLKWFIYLWTNLISIDK